MVSSSSFSSAVIYRSPSRQSLAAGIAVRHLVQIGLCHFDIVTKYLIEANFQVFDSCFFSLPLLQRCQPVFSALRGIPVFIHICIKAIPDNPPVFDAVRRIGMNCGFQINDKDPPMDPGFPRYALIRRILPAKEAI